MGWFDDYGYGRYANARGFWDPETHEDLSINYEGEERDPFAYTHGSLLTPWTRKFQAPAGSSAGYVVPEFKAFNYDDIAYRAFNPGAFGEVYQDPGKFVYGDFQGMDPFQGVTQKDLEADPGYKFRLQQGQKALEASKAAQGILRTGGAAKDLMRYGQDMASQEYGNVYGRKASEYDRSYGQARDLYGMNRMNAAENWDRNVRNALQGYQTRQAAWRDNAAIGLDASRHGFDVTTGLWDRNYAKARQGYDDEASHRAAAAAAANASAGRDYDRAWREYLNDRDEFWTNQDRQYAILDREASRGWDAARTYGLTAADLALGRGNAQASGRVGSANAWTGALGAVGNNLMDVGLYYGTRNQQRRPAVQSGWYGW